MSEITGNVDDVKGDLEKVRDLKFSANTYPLLRIFKKGVSGKVVDFNIAEAKKNIITLGTTGSGKTTSVLLPALENLIKHNNVGLILDVKSELYQDVYHIAKLHERADDIVFIGTQEFCTPINLLASLKNEEQLRNIIAACTPSSGSQNNGDYWQSNGVEDVMNVVSLDRWYNEYKGRKYRYNFNTLLDYILDAKKIKLLYKDLAEVACYMPEGVANTMQKTLVDSFSIINAAINENDSDVQNQKTWRSGQVATVLKPFTEEPFASNLNCEDNPKTLHDLIFKDGKIIVLTIPIEYEAVGFVLGKLLREIYYKSVLSNSLEDRQKLKLGDDFNRYTFLLIDEYQGFVNTKAANGVITDDTWGSISRSFENINIYATQSIRHMDNAIGETAADVIMSNCASEIILRAQDRRTLGHVDLVYNKVLRGDSDFLINPSSRLCVARLESNGGKLCFKGSMEVEDQSTFHTKAYKIAKLESLKDLDNPTNKLKKRIGGLFVIARSVENGTVTMSNGEIISVRDVLIKYLNNDDTRCSSSECMDHEKVSFLNMMVTPYNFDFDEDKMQLLALKLERLSNIKGKILKLNYIKTMGKNGYEHILKPEINILQRIEDDVLFVCQDYYRAWDDVSAVLDIPNSKRTTISALAKNKFKISERIICFVMGGGNLSSEQFNFFRNTDKFLKIKNANPRSIIYTGIGHAGDTFVFDYLADQSFITPTELAIHLKKIGYREKK